MVGNNRSGTAAGSRMAWPFWDLAGRNLIAAVTALTLQPSARLILGTAVSHDCSTGRRPGLLDDSL